MVRFKQSISPSNREILSNRQFVVVDMKSLNNSRLQKKQNIGTHNVSERVIQDRVDAMGKVDSIDEYMRR